MWHHNWSCSVEIEGSFSEGCNSAREHVIGSSFWVGPERKSKRCRAGGRFPPLHSISPLCQWDFLPPFSPRQTPQAHLPGLREVLFQRLPSLMKLNSTTQPTPQGITHPIPLSLAPGRWSLSHPSVLTRGRREEGNHKTETTVPLKSSEQRWFPRGDGSERHRQRLWEP